MNNLLNQQFDDIKKSKLLLQISKIFGINNMVYLQVVQWAQQSKLYASHHPLSHLPTKTHCLHVFLGLSVTVFITIIPSSLEINESAPDQWMTHTHTHYIHTCTKKGEKYVTGKKIVNCVLIQKNSKSEHVILILILTGSNFMDL